MTVVDPDELARWRAERPVLARGTYLANHTLGAMHVGTPPALAEFARAWAEQGVLAWGDWRARVTAVGDLVGEVIGAEPGSTVMRANVADALATVALSVAPDARRREVLLADVDWPGSHHLWQRSHLDLRVVPLAELADSVEDRTAVVQVSAVMFRTSEVVDLEPVVAAARRVGALLVVDAYQAAGCLPLHVAARGLDVVVGGSVKWLCGGPGNGWLSVRPGVDLRAAPGWWGHARPFDFDPLWEPAGDAMAWAGGTPNVMAAMAAEPAYRAVLGVGVARIRERSVGLTQPLVDAVLDHGWELRSPAAADRRGGHVTFDPGSAEEVHHALVAAGFTVDHRPGAGIRVGPHFYNTAEEVSALVAEVERVVG